MLTELPCTECAMPLMEFEKKSYCVVCPVMQKKLYQFQQHGEKQITDGEKQNMCEKKQIMSKNMLCDKRQGVQDKRQLVKEATQIVHKAKQTLKKEKQREEEKLRTEADFLKRDTANQKVQLEVHTKIKHKKKMERNSKQRSDASSSNASYGKDVVKKAKGQQESAVGVDIKLGKVSHVEEVSPLPKVKATDGIHLLQGKNLIENLAKIFDKGSENESYDVTKIAGVGSRPQNSVTENAGTIEEIGITQETIIGEELDSNTLSIPKTRHNSGGVYEKAGIPEKEERTIAEMKAIKERKPIRQIEVKIPEEHIVGKVVAETRPAFNREDVKDRIAKFVSNIGNGNNGFDALMTHKHNLAKLEAEVVAKAAIVKGGEVEAEMEDGVNDFIKNELAKLKAKVLAKARTQEGTVINAHTNMADNQSTVKRGEIKGGINELAAEISNKIHVSNMAMARTHDLAKLETDGGINEFADEMGNGNNRFYAGDHNLAKLEAEVVAKANASEAATVTGREVEEQSTIERAEVKDGVNEFVGEVENKNDARVARNHDLAKVEVEDGINEFVCEMGNENNGLDAVMARNHQLTKLEAEVVEKAKAAEAAIAMAREVLSNTNESMHMPCNAFLKEEAADSIDSSNEMFD